MTLDPSVIVASAAVVGGLLLLIFRSLVSGALHSSNLVPLEHYRALLEINASYPPQIGKQADASTASAQAIRDLTAELRAERAKNGTAT